MPHIHTQPNQHDVTVSGYVLRKKDEKWLCLVHMHRKIDMLMQIGGHMELDETPWQAMAKELKEETGYTLDEVSILQPSKTVPAITNGVVHPVPFFVNTHNVGNEHYHSDLCFGFVADRLPKDKLNELESDDLRWHTIEELRELAEDGIALTDVADIYENLLEMVKSYALISPNAFSLGKPTKGLSYRR